jgi:hypothetical protein
MASHGVAIRGARLTATFMPVHVNIRADFFAHPIICCSCARYRSSCSAKMKIHSEMTIEQQSACRRDIGTNITPLRKAPPRS